MLASLSVFLDFNLPNATTWFYFSFLLAIALFFKFGRLLSIRNGDDVALFALVPGFLLIQGARPSAGPVMEHPAIYASAIIGQSATPGMPLPVVTHAGAVVQQAAPAFMAGRWLWIGYLWLMCGSVYFFARCIFDLALVQRPALSANLSVGGLGWLAGALLICLMAVAFRSHERPGAPPPPTPPPVTAPASNAAPGEGATMFLVQNVLAPPAWAFQLLAVLCHVAIVVGLVVIGWRHFGDVSAGMAAATFYLLLPYTGIYVGQAAHAWPAALLVWAVAAFRFPTLAGTLLGLATGTAFFPLFLLPAWVGFYVGGRGVGRFLVAWLVALVLCLVNLGGVLYDLDTVPARLADSVSALLPWWPPTTEGFWTGVHTAYRLPVFIAYLAFVSATAVWPSPKNLARLIALSAATLVGLQLWYGEHGGAYVLWYAPLLLLLAFRPNLQEHRPPPIVADTDWLARGWRWLSKSVRRLTRLPEPAQAPRA